MRSPNVTTQAGAPFVTFKTILVMASLATGKALIGCQKDELSQVDDAGRFALRDPGCDTG